MHIYDCRFISIIRNNLIKISNHIMRKLFFVACVLAAASGQTKQKPNPTPAATPKPNGTAAPPKQNPTPAATPAKPAAGASAAKPDGPDDGLKKKNIYKAGELRK